MKVSSESVNMLDDVNVSFNSSFSQVPDKSMHKSKSNQVNPIKIGFVTIKILVGTDALNAFNNRAANKQV